MCPQYMVRNITGMCGARTSNANIQKSLEAVVLYLLRLLPGEDAVGSQIGFPRMGYFCLITPQTRVRCLQRTAHTTLNIPRTLSWACGRKG